MAKSYFVILGISPSATADEIKSAYRRLAKEFHPDHYTGGNETFREIQEAYSVLGNARRRQEYEQQISKKPVNLSVKRTTYHPEPETLIPEQWPIDIGEISPVRSFHRFSPSFDEVFDWLWHNFSSMSPIKSRRIENLTLEVPLTREQAFRGGTARILVPAKAVCPACRGYGEIGFYECSRCAGEGDISGEVPVSVSFPSGLTKDHAVMIPLNRFGIHNLHMTVLFRPTDADNL
ncbi:MAG: DnaJ domain-containing protein [Deltaproteobacteria bacterium]|nr:DnaJ domain-containing protein [Deltaproteobacteria bacterium]MBW1957491.1 DnaJ domain-containing protein [Deltaproteobacteria bacterium]MBW2013545.1 DnaJ domain-containing protein [Deltaproteobacteria bacterium]MBW2088542.1 DnaJ domain-containing protein [Deltaproteobacteria bacterium]MBW2321163.1 DnaJ domain-containing protein [Deltaproteobacteria bacterium]